MAGVPLYIEQPVPTRNAVTGKKGPIRGGLRQFRSRRPKRHEMSPRPAPAHFGATQHRLTLRTNPVMAGLVPAIHALLTSIVSGFVYIMSNRRDGVLYVGVTNDLIRRSYEHRHGLVAGFTKRYGLNRLVEAYDDIRTAIQREKTIKHWPRAWKVRLINGTNRAWDDLAEGLQ